MVRATKWRGKTKDEFTDLSNNKAVERLVQYNDKLYLVRIYSISEYDTKENKKLIK